MINPHKVFADFFETSNKTVKAFIYEASEKLSKCHVCVNWSDVEENKDNPFYSEVDSSLDLPSESDFIAENDDFEKPFVFHNNKFYLQRYFTFESNIIKNL